MRSDYYYYYCVDDCERDNLIMLLLLLFLLFSRAVNVLGCVLLLRFVRQRFDILIYCYTVVIHGTNTTLANINSNEQCRTNYRQWSNSMVEPPEK